MSQSTSVNPHPLSLYNPQDIETLKK